MTLIELYNRQGEWLFRYRSYLPLVLAPLFFLSFISSEPITQASGEAFITFFRTLCILISIAGLIVRILTVGYVPKGTSGRNTGSQRADTLNTTGMYSMVRHPLYLSNFLIYIGVIMYTIVWWFVIIAVLLFIIYYERIMIREEVFLQNKFGQQYRQWKEKTPGFFPNIRLWKKPELNFSLNRVLKREHSSFMTLITLFTFTHYGADFFGNAQFDTNAVWMIVFILSFIVFITLRTLKKKKLLPVN